MIITKISAYAVKAAEAYIPTGSVRAGETLPDSAYFRLGGYPQLYSRRAQAALVRVETDEGLVGWGESQAPIGTEVILTLIKEVLGPAVLGRDPEATGPRYDDLYSTLRVRGQIGGFQADAIAGVDTALWDLRGQAVDRSLAELLGGRRRDRLPCYVTGLREHTPEGRREEAARWAEQGIGVKSCLGLGVRDDAEEVRRLRSAIGADATLLVDGFWSYALADATTVGRAFEESGVGFFEAPMAPEDVRGHATLASRLDIPIAVGEPLRHHSAFLPWFESGALGIAQPDLMRNGVTETVRIAELADAFHLPVALHVGCSTPIGQAATWQVASTLPTFYRQEMQPVMLETFGPLLTEPLRLEDGQLVVPTGPGLGVRPDEVRVAEMATSQVTVSL